MSKIAYRREIDGLRAIAVLGVVLYHAGVGDAGFVGVDIFFVISGYLITGLLLREWQTDQRIDLIAFYARRVRRIFPAAAFLVLIVLGASTLLLAPEQVVHTANSAGAALLFSANIFFQFSSGGYFDARAEEMPLLHLWSLSVEEQFYFLWPALLILLLRKRPQWLMPMLVALGLASFAFAEALIRTYPEAAFYQMPARFWELAAGGIVAAMPARALPRGTAWAAMVLTLGACIWPSGHFPGFGALPAVAGATLIIAAIHGGASNRLLGSRPFVGVGLISYSLYLWHWPLLALYRATSIGDGSVVVRLKLCGVAMVLAFASYRYIEQPFRGLRFSSRRTVAFGAGLSAALAAGAWIFGLRPAQVGGDVPPRTCHSMGHELVTVKCPATALTRVGIWGDSMAYAWSPLVWKLDPKASAFTRDACGPFLGYLPDKPFSADLKCRQFNAKIAESVKGLDTLYLVARWQTTPSKFEGLGRTLTQVSPGVRRIVILGPSPEMRDLAPRCIRQNASQQCALSRVEFDRFAAPILMELRKLAAAHRNVEVQDVTNYFCNATSCPPELRGIPLYWDTHHVSMRAASAFALSTGVK